ncbi:hypothetical protein BCY75_09515 [Latilactobacillus curvatus]|uniref:LuxR C-terminal-related transcriptional regulator n=1 Tax=Latilactobacillus curvatus TaxID=28038 RepID=UPI0008151B70|nr:LuxR C-terminal-related transcriptional regulator [Latilactobacillus curvatus]ANY14215.1 hypothetical protein BCY75_09515 [Latilactobacillus curvatus]
MRRRKWRRKTDIEAIETIVLDCDIAHKKFTNHEDKIIRNMVRQGATNKEIAAELNRTESSIRSHRDYINIRKTSPWTYEETAYLIENIRMNRDGVTENINQLTNHFENHDTNAVYHKIAQLRKIGTIQKTIKTGALKDNYFRKSMGESSNAKN